MPVPPTFFKRRRRLLMRALIKKSVAMVLVMSFVGGIFAMPSKAYEMTGDEKLYVKGVGETAYKTGKAYTLYDIGKNGDKELLIAEQKSSGDTLRVYAYDKSKKKIVRLKTFKKATKIYKKSSKTLVVVTKTKPVKTYTEFTVKKSAYKKLFVYTGTKKNGKVVYKKNNKVIKSATYRKYALKVKQKKTLPLYGSTRWAYSSEIGVVNKVGHKDVKTDFYNANFYSFLKEDHLDLEEDDTTDANFSNLTLLGRRITRNLNELFDDTEKHNSKYIKQVRDYYRSATDWEEREKTGVTPVKKLVDEIDGIKSLAEFNKYLSEKSPNLLYFPIKLDQEIYKYDTAKWMLAVDYPQFGFFTNPFVKKSSKDREEDREYYYKSIEFALKRAGYTDEQIKGWMSGTSKLEDALSDDLMNLDIDNSEVTPGSLEELVGKYKNFPLKGILEGFGVTISGSEVLSKQTDYLDELEKYFSDENLENIKAFFITHNVSSMMSVLDRESVEVSQGELEPEDAGTQTAEEIADWEKVKNDDFRKECLDLETGFMSCAMENAYMDAFIEDEKKKDLDQMAVKIKAKMRDVIMSEDWMSDEGKAASLEKLDAMAVQILKPDTLIDSSYLDVDPNKGYAENYIAINGRKTMHKLSYVGKKNDRSAWKYDLYPDMTTTQVNAAYYPTFNCFMLFDGFAGPEFYDSSMSREEKLSKLGAVIGHEITHGFDPLGSKYDKDGVSVATKEHPNGVFPDQDFKVFTEKTKKVADYVESLNPLPWEKYTGSKRTAETIGDIGGIAVCLEVAKEYENFDYDTFFRGYADLWKQQDSFEYTEDVLTSDPHPFRFIRVNAVVQQFDEFIETYGLKKGDRMYLAPKDRIRVW